MATKKRGTWLGATLIAAGVGVAVLRMMGFADALSFVGAGLFLGGVVLVVLDAVRKEDRAGPRELTEYVGAPSYHRAIFDALIAAHPPGVAHVRLVLSPHGTRYEAEISTLDTTALPPSLRKPIEAFAAFLVGRGDTLDRLILEAKLSNDGTWRFAVDVGREPTRR